MSANITLPPSIRDGVYLTLVFGFGLATIAVGIRMYTKLRIVKKFLSEDYFSIIGYCALATYLGLVLGIGKSGNVEHKGYLSMVATVIYDITIVLAKTSILLQYITIFVVHRKNRFHYTCHAFIAANVIMYIIVIFLYIFECNPREKLWIPSTPGKCFGKYGVSTGYINVISDFLILVLPLPILLRLKVSSGKKLRPLLIFGVGFFACVASLIRLVYSLHVNAPPGSIAHQLQIDREGLLAFAEISIGIIVGCLPIVNQFFKHYPLKLPMISSFSAFSSSRDGSSWRRLFSKSPSSGQSGSHQRLESKDSKSAAPKIETLNLTRASFTIVEEEPLKWLKPVHDKNVITGKHPPQEPYLPADDDDEGASPIEEATFPPDLENQAPYTTRPWQQLRDSFQNQTNKKKRARRLLEMSDRVTNRRAWSVKMVIDAVTGHGEVCTSLKDFLGAFSESENPILTDTIDLIPWLSLILVSLSPVTEPSQSRSRGTRIQP